MNHSAVKITLLTVLALIAFAANSVLCRLALGGQSIDAVSFTVIRLSSGVLVLFFLLKLRYSGEPPQSKGNWLAGSMLFVYAISFSYAYNSLDTGTGALILFGSVQISMIFLTLMGGNRLHGFEWLGVLLACGGFVYLMLPSVTTPSLEGFLLMSTAGIAWGIYSLKGRGSKAPLADTAYNFLRTIPMIALVLVLWVPWVQISQFGILMAILSGGLASGMGYAIWYSALPGLSATQAAVVQLAVPIIAAVGGVLFVAEPISIRLMVSACMILGGIFVVLMARYSWNAKKSKL